MKVVVIHGPLDRGARIIRAVRDADAVVRNHHDGTWTLEKCRYGRTCIQVPWDRLPSDVKRAAKP